MSENTFGTRFSRKLVLAEKVIRPGRGNSLKRFLRAVSGGGLETLGEGGRGQLLPTSPPTLVNRPTLIFCQHTNTYKSYSRVDRLNTKM